MEKLEKDKNCKVVYADWFLNLILGASNNLVSTIVFDGEIDTIISSLKCKKVII